MELLAVIVIMGIAATMAAVKWQGRTFEVAAQADQVIQDIRYTQALAMNRAQSAERYRTYFYTSSYRIFKVASDGAEGAVVHPSTGSTNAVQLGSGLFFQSNGFSGGLAFDNLGRPYRGTTLLSSVTSVQISGGGESRTIRVYPNTGATQAVTP
jgi:type II secretory pathway pseudopilin PulG